MFERTLILETSGKVGQVALAALDAIVAEERLDHGQRRASDLTLVVDRLLKGLGWKARELTDVIVGLGPGSYTGLRVGLASAKALAYATGCRFHGVETLAAIALRAPVNATQISVVADALQGKLFRHDFRRVNGTLASTSDLAIINATDWLGTLHDHFVTGPGAALHETTLPDAVHVADVAQREARPIDLLTVATTLPWAVTTDVWRAEPFYLRGSSAEEKARGNA